MKTIADFLTFDDPSIKIALTDKSYKKSKEYQGQKINTSLATLGDSVLKLALADLLYDKSENITEDRIPFETDEFLVRVLGAKYAIINFIEFDKSDEKIPKNYDYISKPNHNPHKYIATAIEALIGAIYLISKRDIALFKSIIVGTFRDCENEILDYLKLFKDTNLENPLPYEKRLNALNIIIA